MKFHWLQHVPFEGLGYIEEWADSQGAELTCTRLFANELLPPLDDIDWLIVMGGPMGIYEHEEYPWLVAEKEFIKLAINEEKTVLGICLGAQLIADACGAAVYPGPQKEIGWFPIKRAVNAPELIPEELIVFHWHGDTFDLPAGAVRMASSEACENQGFVINDRVIGLQFHMETTPESMEAIIESSTEELSNVDGASGSVQEEQRVLPPSSGAGDCAYQKQSSAYVQTAEEMREGISNVESIHAVLGKMLNTLLSQTGL